MLDTKWGDIFRQSFFTFSQYRLYARDFLEIHPFRKTDKNSCRIIDVRYATHIFETMLGIPLGSVIFVMLRCRNMHRMILKGKNVHIFLDTSIFEGGIFPERSREELAVNHSFFKDCLHL